jgi:hypothetical protein
MKFYISVLVYTSFFSALAQQSISKRDSLFRVKLKPTLTMVKQNQLDTNEMAKREVNGKHFLSMVRLNLLQYIIVVKSKSTGLSLKQELSFGRKIM